MKKILFALVMLVSAVGLAQEKTYEVVNENTVAVTIKFEGAPTQKGLLTNVDGVFKPHGIWTQHDENNRVTLRVMYLEGKKVWVEKDLGATQVVINYKEGAI